jgi:pimeloyl-ACP methyl ester carboxylesterase
VNEYPVFIPVDGAHLACVVTVPEDPRGLILLMPGGAGIRSHRHRLWTRAARRLADSGFASLRLEWRGSGDSTGVAVFELDRPPVEDVRDVARFATELTGIERLGAAGNCGGARAALALAQETPTCSSLVLMKLKPFAGFGSGEGHGSKGARRRALSALKKVPALDAAVRKRYWRTKWRRAPVLEQLAAARRRAEVLLMDDDAERPDSQLNIGLRMIARAERLGPFELKDLPGDVMRVFDSIDRQELVLETIVDWFDRTLPVR